MLKGYSTRKRAERSSARHLWSIVMAGAIAAAPWVGCSGTVEPDLSEVAKVEIVGTAPTLRAIGETYNLEARALDAQGRVLDGATITWKSDNSEVVSVSTTGTIMALAAGSVLVTATVGSVAASAQVTVDLSGTSVAEWDSVLHNVTIEGDVVVPAGQKWLIGPNVQIAGNLRTVDGTIAMRPGSSLRFLGADPDEYVGGGMGFAPHFSRDIGMWIEGSGVLDIQGTPKAGWNRTGTDPTWAPTDEYWIAPTDLDDFSPRRWYPGDPIPQIDPRVPPAEVVNVTRDIVIEGPAHIFVRSSQPQRIEYVQLKRMGVSNEASEGPVLGRYGLHFHHSAEGTQGSIVRGVASVDSEGRTYVPHMSHGITFVDNVSVNSYAEAFWWDEDERSNDIMVDRLAVIGVHTPRSVIDKTSMFPGVTLPGGVNMTIKNSVVAGANGSSISHGFNWPAEGDDNGIAVWTFNEGNVAHNNEGAGIRLWYNNNENHIIANSITYRNDEGGVENGAYDNAHRYHDLLLVEDRLVQHAASKKHEMDGGPARFERVRVFAREHALEIGRLNLPSEARTEFIDCELNPGPGSPKVLLPDNGRNAFIALFRNCDVTPDDFEIPTPFSSGLAGTNILIENADGRKWEITLDMDANEKVVRELE